jgi:hypothetical protein
VWLLTVDASFAFFYTRNVTTSVLKYIMFISVKRHLFKNRVNTLLHNNTISGNCKESMVTVVSFPFSRCRTVEVCFDSFVYNNHAHTPGIYKLEHTIVFTKHVSRSSFVMLLDTIF